MKKRLIQGFTLIESLVVVSIFSLITLAVVSIFLTSLKGATKSDAGSEVERNGGYALRVMIRAIRGATLVTTCTGNKVDYTDSLGNLGYFECVGGGSPYIASGSATARLTSDRVKVDPCSISCSGDLREVYIDFTVSLVNSSSANESAVVRFQDRATLRSN